METLTTKLPKFVSPIPTYQLESGCVLWQAIKTTIKYALKADFNEGYNTLLAVWSIEKLTNRLNKLWEDACCGNTDDEKIVKLDNQLSEIIAWLSTQYTVKFEQWNDRRVRTLEINEIPFHQFLNIK